MYRLGIDTGGTNTDVVLTDIETGRTYYAKTATTPKALMTGIMNGIEKITRISGVGNAQLDELVYGTTIVVNMIAQKQTEACALITTRGFRDVLEIGRAYRKDNIYDIRMEAKTPLVKRNLRFEISGRMNFQGKETEPLRPEELPAIVEKLRAGNVRAAAICLMHSYANPAHELTVKAKLKELWPEGFISASAEINPQFREYERTSTTVINAYMMPAMGSHIRDFERHMADSGIRGKLYMMQSNAGVMTFDVAESKPAAVADSGPIAGIIAANYLAKSLGEKNIITFDIGGTSTDVSLIQDNRIKFTTESHIEGYPISVPSVDLSFIGAGGGSVAYVDRGGALKVGPVSAGADPGPVCYGRGGERPTVTDANLVTGHIRPEIFEENLENAMETTKAAIAKHVAEPLGLSVMQAAEGILAVVNSNMLRAIKLISVQKGYDPREFTLVCYGGGGGMHAGKIAEELEMEKVIVPYSPGTFSAMGLVLSDIKSDFVHTRLLTREQVRAELLNGIYGELDRQGLESLRRQRVPEESRLLLRTCDMRYFGQAFEISVPVSAGEITGAEIEALTERFHEMHRQMYGHCMQEDPVEFVNYRVSAVGSFVKPDLLSGALAARREGAARQLRGRAVFDGREYELPIYDRDTLPAGTQIEGPAVIGEMGATVVVYPGHTARVDEMLNIVMYTHAGTR